MDDRVVALTEGQRVCLRLVFQRRTSKEIARELLISKDTVDQRIARAVKAIGARNREDAALLLAEAEGLIPVSRVVYDTTDIAVGHEPPDLQAPVIDRNTEISAEISALDELMEERAVYEPGLHQLTGSRPLPRRKGVRRNDLTFLQTIGWIVAAIAALSLGAGMLIAALASVSQLILGLRH